MAFNNNRYANNQPPITTTTNNNNNRYNNPPQMNSNFNYNNSNNNINPRPPPPQNNLYPSRNNMLPRGPPPIHNNYGRPPPTVNSYINNNSNKNNKAMMTSARGPPPPVNNNLARPPVPVYNGRPLMQQPPPMNNNKFGRPPPSRNNNQVNMNNSVLSGPPPQQQQRNNNFGPPPQQQQRNNNFGPPSSHPPIFDTQQQNGSHINNAPPPQMMKQPPIVGTQPPIVGAPRANYNNNMNKPPIRTTNRNNNAPPPVSSSTNDNNKRNNKVDNRNSRTNSNPRRRSSRDNRIDPKQIPRPIFSSSVSTYKTNSTKSLIPTALSPYEVVDLGGTSPRFCRMSMKNIPRQKELLKTCGIPFGAMIRPIAPAQHNEDGVSRVDFREGNGPIRCERCGAFVSSFCTFENDGATWNCKICNRSNNVPPSYKSPLDAYGHRYDKNDRPELSKGTVEYLVPKQYSIRPLQENIYLILIDVSLESLQSGLFQSIISNIKFYIENEEIFNRNHENTKIGIVTYDSQVHFYNVNNRGEDIPVITMSDVQDPFAPLPASAFLINVKRNKERIEQLLDMLIDIFIGDPTAEKKGDDDDNDNGAGSGLYRGPSYLKNGNAFGAAITAAAKGLDVLGGRIVAFQSSLPSVGVGAMKNREDVRVYGRKGEVTMWFPDANQPAYKKLGQYCVEKQISVDLISCCNGHDQQKSNGTKPAVTSSFADVATIGTISKLTGGDVLNFSSFNIKSKRNTERLKREMLRILTNDVALESVLKIRCSEGLRPVAIHGCGVAKTNSETNIPVVKEDTAFCATFEYTQDLPENESTAYLQISFLYTTTTGERVVRVFNIVLSLTSQLSSVFRHSNIDVVTNLLCKKALSKIDSETSLTTVREAMLKRCIKILHAYRKFCATASSSGQLILPEALKFLPLLALALRKSVWLRSNKAMDPNPEINADSRATAILNLQSSSAPLFTSTLYPFLFCLNGITEKDGTRRTVDETTTRRYADKFVLPKPDYPSSENLSEDGLVLLVAGLDIYFWVGRKVDRTIIQHLFGMFDLPTNPRRLSRIDFHRRENDLSQRIHNIIDCVKRRLYTDVNRFRTHIVLQSEGMSKSNNALENTFLSYLIEDKTRHGMSHVEMLCHVHKKIQQKMNEYD